MSREMRHPSGRLCSVEDACRGIKLCSNFIEVRGKFYFFFRFTSRFYNVIINAASLGLDSPNLRYVLYGKFYGTSSGTPRYSTVLYGTPRRTSRYSMVLYGTPQYSTIRYGALWCSKALHSTLWFSMVFYWQYSTVLDGMLWYSIYGTLHYSTLLYSILWHLTMVGKYTFFVFFPSYKQASKLLNYLYAFFLNHSAWWMFKNRLNKIGAIFKLYSVLKCHAFEYMKICKNLALYIEIFSIGLNRLWSGALSSQYSMIGSRRMLRIWGQKTSSTCPLTGMSLSLEVLWHLL